MKYEAILFDGKTAEEQKVFLAIDSQEFMIYQGDEDQTLSLLRGAPSSIRSSSEGRVDITLTLDGVTAHIICCDPQFLSALRRAGFKGAEAPSSRKTLKMVGGLLLINALLITGIYRGMTPFAYWVAREIPYEVEAELFGNLASQKVLKQHCLGSETDAILSGLVKTLLGPSHEELPVQVHLMDWEMANAFALPGGHIILTKGLMNQAESGSEIVGVLAHEIAHVKERHVMGEYLRSTLSVATWAVLFGDYSGLMLVDPQTFTQILELSFSRTAEEEADHEAVRMLAGANISREGLVQFFERLANPQNAEESDWQFPEFLSTHPDSGARAAKIRLEGTGPSNNQGISDRDFRALKNWTCLDPSEKIERI